LEILAYILSFFIGISLSMLGSGGTILTVPLLVYLLHVSPVYATHYSMFIVGITSAIGVLIRIKDQKPDFKTVISFLIPSVISLYVTRKFILPSIPEFVYQSSIFTISKSTLLMTLFAVVMFVAAASMIFDINQRTVSKTKTDVAQQNSPAFVLVAVFIGMLTGLLGAGGGFLIVPALIYMKKNSMHLAVSTSLLIITVNSIMGFVSDIHDTVQWKMVLGVALVAIIGMLSGWKISLDISENKLKRIFGYTVLFIGVLILLKEWVL